MLGASCLSRRCRGGLAAVAILSAAWPAAAITRRSIAIDGDFDDWAIVLRDQRNYVSDLSRAGGDPDVPGTADRDLRYFAATWDADKLYLYFRRTDSGSNSAELLAYVDLDDDQRLGSSDLVLEMKFNGSTLQGAGAFRYAPAAAPASDAITGDGVDEPGALGAAVAHDLTARASADGVEFEASISWSRLGVPAGAALNFHASIAQGTNLPSQVEDNAAMLTTRFREMLLAADGSRNSTSPGQAEYAHRVEATGNQADTFNLTAVSPRGFRTNLFTDPDCDGNPIDGVAMADDLNGNGSYLDAGDVLNPASDSDLDGRPDSGVLSPGSGFCFVLRVVVPGGVPNGSEDRLRLTASSANLGTLFAENFDTTIVGLMAIAPDRSKLAVEGTEVWYPHQVCNLSGADDSVNLAVTSSQGWPVQVYSDPNGDGNPSDGLPISNTGTIGNGSCSAVVVVVQVPAGTALGTQDTATLTGSLALQPAVVETAVDRTTVAPRLTLTPDRSGISTPGGSAFYAATIENAWYETATLDLSATSSLGGKVSFWSDPNGDGDPSDGEPILIAGPVGPNGGTFPIVVQIDIPDTAQQGVVDTTTAVATDRNDPSVRAQAVETTQVRALATYADSTRVRFTTVFPRCVTVYARANSLDRNSRYRFEWYDALGNARRIWPNAGANPDALGQLDDSLAITITDPIGVWSVRIKRRQGNTWVDVTPGGSADFTITDDLGNDGGIISSLSTDKLNYLLTGDNLTARAVLENPSNITYPATFIDYVVFRDGDGDERPTAGETYITLAGTPATWGTGQTSCRTTGLPDILPTDRYLDTSCTIGSIQFTTSGVWNLCTTWLTQCGAPIALECVKFNVGCSPADLPPAAAGPDRSVCLGESTTLGAPAQPGLEYDWDPVVYLDDPRIAQPTAAPPVSLTYKVTVTNPVIGCVNTDEVTVTVDPLPVPDAGPDVVVCGTVPARIGVDPGPGVTCAWSPATGLSSASACAPDAVPSATTVYEVTWTETATGCSASDTVTARVYAPPPADAGPDTYLCAGSPGVTIGTPAVPGLVYRWSPATDLSDPNAAQPVASPATTTTYTVTVTDTTSGCESRDSVTVTPGGPVARSGGPGPVTAPIVIGVGPCDPNLEYSWQPAAGLSDPSICNPFADPTTTTVYCLTVRDRTSGCSSAPDCITVEPAPQPNCDPAQLPGKVTRVRGVRAGAARSDVHLEWDQEPKSTAGYHGYAVTFKIEIPTANTAPGRRFVFATTPSVLDTRGDDPGAVPGPANELFYYQVVGVCQDGVTEGEL